MVEERFVRSYQINAAAAQRSLNEGSALLNRSNRILSELAEAETDPDRKRWLHRMANRIIRAISIVESLPRVPGLPEIPKEES